MLINGTNPLKGAMDTVRSREIKHMNHAWDCFGAVLKNCVIVNGTGGRDFPFVSCV